ncbi:hypothetical protein HH310_00950 [Actinoplanes sp. TBRC 11911]|uniref:hypothetical protein n=1 Tax=Actinoplanes sp. TBRC 11911 TaxID=2729386 RepID=UPI00145CF713|nr:hypothetical protein [Actinoplanes sp. TBRC 11911]NMO49768.1 hypothetical protein [Actinoplanes sp. TBRC 11911]
MASDAELLGAVADRPAGTTPAEAIVQVLIAGIDPADVLDGPPGAGPDFEDQLTAVLASSSGRATPAIRAHAIQLAGLVRLLASDEVRRAVAVRMPGLAATNEVKAILWAAAEAVNRAYP